MKTFLFLEWYGILLLESLFEVHSLQKIHPTCNIPEIISLRDYHYRTHIDQATVTAPML